MNIQSKNQTRSTSWSAKDAKNHFGSMLDEAMYKPVFVEKHGRRIAVVMSAHEYDLLETINDTRWVQAAQKAERKGYIGKQKSAELLKNILKKS